MSEFQVGDRVKVVKTYCNAEVGDLGTVDQAPGGNCSVGRIIIDGKKHDCGDYWFSMIGSELVPAPVEVGSRVRVTKDVDRGHGPIPAGTILTVEEFWEGKPDVPYPYWVTVLGERTLLSKDEVRVVATPKPEPQEKPAPPEPTVVELITQALERIQAIEVVAKPGDREAERTLDCYRGAIADLRRGLSRYEDATCPPADLPF